MQNAMQICITSNMSGIANVSRSTPKPQEYRLLLLQGGKSTCHYASGVTTQPQRLLGCTFIPHHFWKGAFQDVTDTQDVRVPWE